MVLLSLDMNVRRELNLGTPELTLKFYPVFERENALVANTNIGYRYLEKLSGRAL